MGNSCTREADVVLSERGVGGARGQRHDGARGRWSGIEYQGSVDLDTLLEAPSPAQGAGRRRRKSSRSKSKSEKSRSNSGPRNSGPPRENNGSFLNRKKQPRKLVGRQMSTTQEEEEAEYRSYEDPGYIATGDAAEMMLLDSDCILQSPTESFTSPTVIHARWGEPVEDPEEKEVCTEYRPNPFKLGFCVNCQKQHDVNENGDVASQKEYKKIARPTISKTAANALDNPAAVENLTPRNRESDVDLTALLQQRRDILLKLTKIDQEKSRMRETVTDLKITSYDSPARHTMFVADSSGTTLANLRRLGSNGRTGTANAPQSLRVNRTTSSVVVSPRGVSSMRGISKSMSLSDLNGDDDEEPAKNDWL